MYCIAYICNLHININPNRRCSLQEVLHHPYRRSVFFFFFVLCFCLFHSGNFNTDRLKNEGVILRNVEDAVFPFFFCHPTLSSAYRAHEPLSPFFFCATVLAHFFFFLFYMSGVLFSDPLVFPGQKKTRKGNGKKGGAKEGPLLQVIISKIRLYQTHHPSIQ